MRTPIKFKTTDSLNKVLSALDTVEKINALVYFSNNLTLSDVAKQLNKQKSSIQRYVKSFREAVLLDEKNRITEFGKSILGEFCDLTIKLNNKLPILLEEKGEKAKSALDELATEALKFGVLTNADRAKLEEVKRILEKLG